MKMRSLGSLRFLTVLLFLFSVGCSNSDKKRVETTSIVYENKSVNSLVLQLLDLTGIKHNDTLADIVEKTQQQWLRKPGAERWEIESVAFQNEAKIKEIFEQLGLLKDVKPLKSNYTYLLMLGALFSTMQKRFEYAIALWKSGIRFESIVLLGSARPAVADQGENVAAFLAMSGKETIDNIPSTEAEMLQFIYQQSDMPQEMRELPVYLIDVPMLPKSDGSMRRPTTADTIEWWLKTNPVAGTCLAISNQPYVWYQQSVLKTLLPQHYPIETVGAQGQSNISVMLMLDTVARILYQENLRLK